MSGPIAFTVRGSQPSGSRTQRRSIHTKIAVTIMNWIASGTRMPANPDQSVAPATSAIRPMSTVTATLMASTFM